MKKLSIVNSLRLLLLFAMGLFAFTSCEKEKNDSNDNKSTINFNLRHLVGNQNITRDSFVFENEAGNQYSIITLKYFISDIKLHKADGSEILIDIAHYVDLEDQSTHHFETSIDAQQEFSGISFVFGLDTNKNKDGSFPNAPENNMEWPEPMGGSNNAGYHYMKLEGKYLDTLGMVMNYNVHTGASMGHPYHVNISLDKDFISSVDGVNFQLIMDVNQWFANPNTYDFNDYGMMIMGNQDAQNALQMNGNSVFDIVQSIE